MTPEQAHTLIHSLFDTFTDFNRPVEDIADVLTADYVQRVDGNTFDIDGFLDHARALRSVLTDLVIEIERFVTDGASAASVHIAHAVRASGETMRVRVVAFYTFRDGRIAGVDELTHPLEKDHDEIALGSISTRQA